jgi:single-strand DNA-binding protein
MSNASVNKVILIGRLTRDPDEPRTLPTTGNQVVRFGFAVGRARKNPTTGAWENDPNPMFIDCEAFSRGDNTRLVDLIRNYLRKGSQIYLEGRLQLDTWNDKTSGEKRSKHKLVVEEIQFLESRPEDGGDGNRNVSRGAPASGRGSGPSGGSGFSSTHDDMNQPVSQSNNEDDIPF